MPLPFLRGSSVHLYPSDSPLSLGKGKFLLRPTFLACVGGPLGDALPHLAAGLGIFSLPTFWAITFLLSLAVRQFVWGAVLTAGVLTWGGLIAGEKDRGHLFCASCPMSMSTQMGTKWALDNTSQLANHILHSLHLQAWVRGCPEPGHQRKVQ